MGRKQQEFDTTVNPSPEMLARGKAFSAWFRSALKLSPYKNVSQLAAAMSSHFKREVPRQSLYPFEKDCISGDGRFRRPSEKMIREIATVLGANADDGIAAMYGKRPEFPGVPSAIANLPGEVQAALATFVTMLSPTDVVMLPVVGGVSAGNGATILEHTGERIAVLREMIGKYEEDTLFAVRVRGYCLAGAHIVDGDTLICRRADTAQNGDLVIVGDGDDVIVKRYIEDEYGRWLETEPESGEPQEVPVSPEARIVGVVISQTRTYR
jgi:SOS-response transcriptional repressor LexA